MIDKYTAQAPTKDQAIEKGLKALGITKNEAIIEVTNPGKKGFLGIGQKDAIVTVKRKEKSNVMKDVFADNPITTESSKSNEATQNADSTVEVEAATLTETSERSSEEEVIEPIAEDPKEVQEAMNDDAWGNKSESKEKQSGSSEEPIFLSNQHDEEGIEEVKQYLANIVKKMGVEDAVVYADHDGKRVQYNIETEDAGLIIGRHGKVLNGLQTLAQIQLHQQADSKLFVKVDAENYRDRRKQTIEQLARRTADKVKQTNRPVILEPMPAHERKQIHRYLNTYPDVSTHSEGKEPHRYLVVEPAKK